MEVQGERKDEDQMCIRDSAKGLICMDYRKDLVNVERQLDALNILEKEDYQCKMCIRDSA